MGSLCQKKTLPPGTHEYVYITTSSQRLRRAKENPVKDDNVQEGGRCPPKRGDPGDEPHSTTRVRQRFHVHDLERREANPQMYVHLLPRHRPKYDDNLVPDCLGQGTVPPSTGLFGTNGPRLYRGESVGDEQKHSQRGRWNLGGKSKS